MDRPLISVRDLTKTYILGEVDVRALRGVSNDVAAGEFLALTGPSGSGKSTFMHLLGCLDRPTSGTYLLNGRDVSGLTNRQLGVARLVAQGLTNAGLARALFISTKAVDHHVSAILTKLGVANRRDVIRRARSLGLV